MPERSAPFAAFAALALSACGVADLPANDASGSAIAGSDAVQALLKEAREALQDGDLADAGQLLEEARGMEPENAVVWSDIARLRYRSGEHALALEAVQFALELAPRYAPALLLRAQMVRDAHGLTAALPWFESAIDADPDNPEMLGEYAATLGDAGYFTRMLEVTRELLEIEPRSPRALYLNAVLAARAGETVLAKSLLERSGLAAEGVSSAMLLDALIDLSDRRYDSAAETLAELSLRQPGNRRVSELFARSLWLGARDDELVERFAQQARRDDASPYLIMLVGRALERQGNRKSAAPYLERAYAGRVGGWVTLSPDASLPEPTARMRELVSAQNISAARRYARRLQSRYPASADISALSGDAALADGQFAQALELYGKAAKVRRPWPLTRKAGAAYRSMGEDVAADVLIARHLAGEPRNTEALLLVAEWAARREDWLRVAVLLDNAITLGAGNDPRLLKLRGIAARALGKDEDARRFERMTWELHPGILPQG